MTEHSIQQTFNLAVEHHRAGRLHEAEQLYRQILSQKPEHPDALRHLGVIAHQVARNDAAIELFRRAIALRPNFAEAFNNLGTALKDKGQLDQAVAAFGQAIAFRPDYADAHSRLGDALRDIGRLDEAIAAWRRAIELKPSAAEAHNNLGVALERAGRLDEAVAVYRQAIAINPGFAELHGNLGNTLKQKKQFDEAIAAYRAALALNPNLPEAYNNLGIALKDKGQLDESIAAGRKAALLRPDYAAAHYNLAMSLLLRGELEEGFAEYEWRWKVREFPSPRRNFPQPLWDGGDLQDRTILLYAEQGIGDAIQFIRYAPLLARRGGRVIVEVQPELIRLLRQFPGIAQWIPTGRPLPAFDVQCPLVSLPSRFGTTPATIPPQNPPLAPDPDLVEMWRPRFAQEPRGLKVGLVWAGNPKHVNDANRSISLSQFEPLWRVSGIHFFSLQKGDAAKQATNPPAGMPLVDWTDDLHDFADTAAMVSQLDLVISVDTSVAHLSAAMGKPTWMLIVVNPDWRWMMERSDSPWYPAMRLFRQTAMGNWSDTIDRVGNALAAFRA